MPCCKSKYFGELEYSDDAVLTLPRGLLGFEDENAFILIQRPDEYPLVYIQSRASTDLCFLALPILAVDSEYRLEMTGEDAKLTGLNTRPAIGTDALCLALITVHTDGPTANLLAPIVINLQTHVGCQSINVEPGYSHQHCLTPAKEGAAA